MTKDLFIRKVATSLRKIIERLPEDLEDRLDLLYDYLLPSSTLAYYTVPGIPAEFTFYEGFFILQLLIKENILIVFVCLFLKKTFIQRQTQHLQQEVKNMHQQLCLQ